nr:unnamed protein product [Fasciola hepatica]
MLHLLSQMHQSSTMSPLNNCFHKSSAELQNNTRLLTYWSGCPRWYDLLYHVMEYMPGGIEQIQKIFDVLLQCSADFNTTKGFSNTGAEVSVLLRPKGDNSISEAQTLRTANGTAIPTFDQRSFPLNLGLKRNFRWVFIIADVPYPILSIDFLQHFNLSNDAQRRGVVDRQTNLALAGYNSRVNQVTPFYVQPPAHRPYGKLIAAYPAMFRQAGPCSAKTTNVTHYIDTKGPPVFSKSRQLAPDKLRVAQAEFEHKLELGIKRPSSSPRASPLHIVPKSSGDWRLFGDYRTLNKVTVTDRYPIPHIQDLTSSSSG